MFTTHYELAHMGQSNDAPESRGNKVRNQDRIVNDLGFVIGGDPLFWEQLTKEYNRNQARAGKAAHKKAA